MEKKIVSAILLIVALSLCAQAPGKPEIKSLTNCWGNIASEVTEIITEILVYNPNPFSIPLKDILTEIYMNELKMGEGKALKAEIPPGESEIILSTEIKNNRIPEWFVSHIKNGEKTDVKLKGYLVFDLRLTEFKYPFEQSSTIKTNLLSELKSQAPKTVSVGPMTFTIKSINAYWGKVEKDYTEIIIIATISNENPISVLIPKYKYYMEMNGIKVASGINDLVALIPPMSEASLTFVIKIENEMLDEWFVSHLKNKERSEIKIVIEPFIEISGKEISFVLIESKSYMETKILGCWR
ncbi:MAG: LEA type 2 family protein [Archaeoglobaceae archaeon]